jgi:hypothetical protein
MFKSRTAPNQTVGEELAGFGGYLRCESCRRREPLGNPGRRVLGEGWPKCCGYTMRWWTQRQIDAGEVPL